MITTQNLKKDGSGVVVFSERVRIGYINKGKDNIWLWELILLSEQFKGYPRGISDTKEDALNGLSDMFVKWCKAAGLEQSKGK
jgi:hypothetical protein